MSLTVCSTKVLLLLSLIFCSASCRKKIFVPASETTVVGEAKYGLWTKVPVSISKVGKMCVEDGKMYFSAKKYGLNKISLMKFTLPGTFQSFVDYNLATSVADIKVYNGKLFYGGQIYSSSSSSGLLSSCNLPQLNNVTSYFSQSGKSINGMAIFDNKLYFGGTFSVNSTVAQNYIAAINGTTIDNSMGPLYISPNGLYADASRLYAYGVRVQGATNYSGIAYMDGNSWIPVTNGGNQDYKNVKSMVVIPGEGILFSYSEMYEETVLLGMISSVYFQPVTGIEATGNAKVSFKVVEGTVYAFGSGISVNGKATNVVFRKPDGTWGFNKIITETVNDVIFFNNKLYASCESGLFYE